MRQPLYEEIDKDKGICDKKHLSTVLVFEKELSEDCIYYNRKHMNMVFFRVLKGIVEIESSRPKIVVKKGEIGFVGVHLLHNVILKKGTVSVQSIAIHMGFILSNIHVTTLFHQIIKVSAPKQVHFYFNNVLDTVMKETVAGALAYRGSLSLLLAEVANQVEAVDDLEFTNKSFNIQKIIEYIEYNFDKKLSLDILSAEFNFTPQYISYLFKVELNTTFYHYLTYKRLKNAIYLINTTEFKVIDIAYTCGFSNERAFVKFFKERYGLTPSQYRTSIKD